MAVAFCCIVVLTFVIIYVIRIDGLQFPKNEYEFSLSRDRLLKAEEKFERKDSAKLSPVSSGVAGNSALCDMHKCIIVKLGGHENT